MRHPPLSRNRLSSSCASFDLDEFLTDLASVVGFDGYSNFEPGEYQGAGRRGGDTFKFAVEYLFRNIVSKYDDADPATDVVKTRKALEKFSEAEALCSATNRRFERYFLGHRPDNLDVSAVIRIARDKIWRVLGTLDLDEIARGFTFTGGASRGLPRYRSSAAHKYSVATETTDSAKPYVETAMRLIPKWDPSRGGPGTVVVPGNRLTCVPKNYKVHRLIAQEPSGNMYIQKGIGAALRRRLEMVGVQLRDQTLNQDFALLGSATGLVATVDMSMASDTVASTVVEWLLPPDWHELLNAVRSQTGVLPCGTTVLYRKFSSMGNAFTFELESLIFWAIAQACCVVGGADGRFVAVYGDDVVVPVRCVSLFLDSLEEFGFVPNADKSFWDGEGQRHGFRESCGKHYLNGEDVSPFYVKTAVRDVFDLFLLVNNTRRWVERVACIRDAPDSIREDVIQMLSKYMLLAPNGWTKPRIPNGYGDGAFIGAFDEILPKPLRSRKRPYAEGYIAEVLSRSPITATYFQPDGTPLVKNGKEYRPADKHRRVGRSLTENGYLLSVLHRAENGPPTFSQISNTLTRLPLRYFAMALLARDYSEESAGVMLDPVGEVRKRSMIIFF